MLAYAELFFNLGEYENTYNNATGVVRTQLLASKSSILEVCGWVEQAMDLLVRDCATRCVISTDRIQILEKDYIKKTSGFSYQDHFAKMMVAVVGYRILEKAELNSGALFTAMCGALTYLTPFRNHYAHTHLDTANPYPNGQTSICSPTVMRNHAQTTIDGLLALEKELKKLGC